VRVVSAHYHVDEWIADQLVRVIRRRDPAEQDGNVGTRSFDAFRDGQATLHVYHPVQIDADDGGIDGANQRIEIDAGIAQENGA
jgi:hypothetical protein